MLQPAMMLDAPRVPRYRSSSMRAPESRLAVGMSLFPTMTPFAMMLRMVMPPGPPLWQVRCRSSILIATTGSSCGPPAASSASAC